jgi:regulator of CtrA degradation
LAVDFPVAAIGNYAPVCLSQRTMAKTATISSRIVEGLYCEALVLSDEVRAAFDLSGRLPGVAVAEDQATVALSCEALRTTTRMMHAVAWLLNHRAYFAGELSEFQLRRHGRLASFPGSDPAHLALVEPPVRSLIMATERFHARLFRLDQGWRDQQSAEPGAVMRLREQLGQALAG